MIHDAPIALFSLRAFVLPGAVGILLALGLWGVPYTLLCAISIGVVRILLDSWQEIRQGKYSLDYVAFVAMVVSLISEQYLAGAIIALMFTGGKALESFASQKAHAALKSLSDTIPKTAFVFRHGAYEEVSLQDIAAGEKILVKRNEIVPLDGTLASKDLGVFDLSNLTGEVAPVTLKPGTAIKSGSINVGEIIELVTVGDFSTSTYHKIVQLVDEAHAHPARMVRLSEKANIYFTFVAFVCAGLAYLISGELARALAVLVIATPCPLIIAAPVAFIGGMSRLARNGIVLRKPAALEGLDQATAVFFDKTGTLTMGDPAFTAIELVKRASRLTEEDVLRIAASIEVHSLHPLARAVVREADKRNIAFPIAENVVEKIGVGITGYIEGASYTVTGSPRTHQGIALVLKKNGKDVAYVYFADTLKEGVEVLLGELTTRGVRTEIITGDSQENAERVFGGLATIVHADASPGDKYALIEKAEREGEVVVMVGDGLNDAPALARAGVGVVFSGAENGASIGASDIVMLDSRIEKLSLLFSASHRTVRIARQSIYGGIFLSSVGMVCAAFGYIAPVHGALMQEAIDVVVILNALRSLRA